MEKKSLPERFEHLKKLISSKGFLKKEGISNEVPFFICPYAPQEANKMKSLQEKLINQLEQSGVNILEINLYELSIEILKTRGIWDKILSIEPTTTKPELKELLQSVLDTENHLVPAIAQKIAAAEFDVLFLTGIGEVFPYIRAHSVLNNLQSTATLQPTVIFFPGAYKQNLESGATLDLFDRLHDDKYYRAFNIYDCEN
jgi:hypothetical protein